MLRSALLAKLGINGEVKKPKLSKKSEVSKKIAKSKLKPKIRSIDEEYDEEIQELEAQFRVNAQTVKKAIKGLITFTLTNPKLKNQLFDDDQFHLFVQINSIKVPKGHLRIARIPLKHSLFTPDSEVCLIVPDVKGIPNKNHEDHLERYEKLLSDRGVTCIKKIMTFHEFRTEYETFELKNRLVELYDTFLVDGRISGKTVKKCGKIFYKKRKIPTAVKLQASKLKEHIENTLKKTPLYLHGKGDSFVVQIGHSKMDIKDLVENIFYLLKGLNKEFPGGFNNIRSLNLFAFRGLSFPIYTTLKNKNQVPIPEDVTKSKPVEEYTGELTTKLNSGVRVKSTGEVTEYMLNDEKNVEKAEVADDEEIKDSKIKKSPLAAGNKKIKHTKSVEKKEMPDDEEMKDSKIIKSQVVPRHKKIKHMEDETSANKKENAGVSKMKIQSKEKGSKSLKLKKKKQKL